MGKGHSPKGQSLRRRKSSKPRGWQPCVLEVGLRSISFFGGGGDDGEVLGSVSLQTVIWI